MTMRYIWGKFNIVFLLFFILNDDSIKICKKIQNYILFNKKSAERNGQYELSSLMQVIPRPIT